MIMKRWLAGVSAVALAASLSLVAGGAASSSPPTPRPDHLGTDFWVTFPRNFDGANMTAKTLAAVRRRRRELHPRLVADGALEIGRTDERPVDPGR